MSYLLGLSAGASEAAGKVAEFFSNLADTITRLYERMSQSATDGASSVSNFFTSLGARALEIVATALNAVSEGFQAIRDRLDFKINLDTSASTAF